jgi:hypothetical protein
VSAPAHLVVIDWRAVVEGLRRAGLSFQAISMHANLPKSTVIGYRDGATPKHPDGERLIELWCGTTNHTREQLPKTRAYPSAAHA